MSTLDAFFDNVKLPTISEVGHELIKTLNDEDASMKQVSGIIARDPALIAKLLRLANSASFGLPRGVSSVDDAISMVGMAKVRTLSLASCFNDSFPALPGLNPKEFWANSMATAGYAQWMAGGIGADTQQAWLTGMMLRLGELLIGQADPVTLKEIEKDAGSARKPWWASLKARSRVNLHGDGIFRRPLCRACSNLMSRSTTSHFPGWPPLFICRACWQIRPRRRLKHWISCRKTWWMPC